MASSALRKTFGAGVDVSSQLATDRALRRKTTSTVNGFDLSAGQLVRDHTFAGVAPFKVPHSLSRVAAGAIVIKSTATGDTRCVATSATDITVDGVGAGDVVSFWVV